MDELVDNFDSSADACAAGYAIPQYSMPGARRFLVSGGDLSVPEASGIEYQAVNIGGSIIQCAMASELQGCD
jgi:hypothetical protein